MAKYDKCAKYKYLSTLIIGAGIIGLIESLIWLGMSITGICAYYCTFNIDKTIGVNLGTYIYILYFRGSCETKFSSPYLENVTVLQQNGIHIWMWVYMGASALWMLSSITLLIRKEEIILLYLWTFIATLIMCSDTALGIILGIDYKKFNDMGSGHLPPVNTYLEVAKISSIIMMIVALRGFVLWIINSILIVYFASIIFASDKKPPVETSYDNHAFTGDSHSILTRSPINAYAPAKPKEEPTVHLNVEPLHRAHMMSITSLKERIERDIRSHPRHSAGATNGYSGLKPNNSFKPGPYIPQPDYSPNMSRSKPYVVYPPKSSLKNARYQ